MADENEIDLNESFKLEGQEISLGDLAGLNLDEVQEKRFEALPKGDFVFEVESAKLAVNGEGDKKRPVVAFKTKVLDVIRVNDNDFTGKPEDLVGKIHAQLFFITSLDSVGYIKAFLKDIGVLPGKDFNSTLAHAAGVRFQAPIGKRKDPNDSDKVYTQINQMKIKPLVSAPASSIAQAVK